MNTIGRRSFLSIAGFGGVAFYSSFRTAVAEMGKRPPNFVIILLDDSGWGDFTPFANPEYETPNVARLAKEGCCFRNFYVSQAICSASRSALLSGCYPERTKVFGALGPGAKGLDPKYATLGEVLKARGYTTAIFGKWHIGDQEDTRPWARGFDEFCGLMYSNDMWEFHPEHPNRYINHPLHFWENNRVSIQRMTKEHQPMLTTWYTEHAVDFIQRQKDRPFFLYVPHSMPHVPIFASEKFRGKSGVGLYGDVMMEIDWSVGEIMNSLKANGVEENTLVIFTSDNGPWISYGNHAGKTPFREAKATSFDGGVRSACTMRFPGRIKPGTSSDRTFNSVDLLPTISYLSGAELPSNLIDGKNVWPLIVGEPDAENPHEYYPFSTDRQFEGVISGDGRWKLHLPHKYRTLVRAGQDGNAGEYRTVGIELSLFDMENDPFETTNVLEKHPEIAAKLQDYAARHKTEYYAHQQD